MTISPWPGVRKDEEWTAYEKHDMQSTKLKNAASINKQNWESKWQLHTQ